MVKVAICGGSGYAGAELLRILAAHHKVKITAVTSEKSVGKKVTDLFPHLHQYANLAFEPLVREKIVSKADLFFMALPHAESQEPVDYLVKKKKPVIDLSADYRLRDEEIYEEWYKVPHKFADTLKKAVYGLPEIYRKKIATARLVANPGCYPTGALIGLYPAVRHAIVDPGYLIIDSKSGTSGAGRQSDIAFSFCEVNEGFKAYAIGKHRHTAEIEQELSLVARKDIKVNFTPHLVPLDRGILTTLYARLTKEMDTKGVLAIYRDAYVKEPFVRVLEEGKYPNVKNIRGINLCEIGLTVNRRTNTLIIVTAIDNLVKGASGQAVQNMNIMLGFDEKTALNTMAVFP
ncbi:MAG TPA: N-acetyl-gamma-glutamyl-phosphate reductase [Nitrospiraceae bacterium]|jgi:N-acetyl-gamma-glutamyl-phosphate reductase|nr:N-acetyl-gamma-glutamyl-phosphate reductase [Nitrospiraceae bacterium]